MMQVNCLVIVWEFTRKGTGAVLKRNAPRNVACPLVCCLCSLIDGFFMSWLTTKLLDLCVFCFSQSQYG